MAESHNDLDAQVYGMPEARPAEPVGGSGPAPDDFEKALAEYGERVPAPKVEAEPPAQAEPTQQLDADEILRNLPAELKADLESRYNSGLYHLQELAQKVSAERDRQDAQRLFDSMKQDFPDLSPRMVKAMLTDKYYTDERTASAWRDRYGNSASWTREVERIRGELAIESRSRIDWDQTATVAAVDAAIMRGQNGPPREPAIVDYNSMTNSELKTHRKREHGYTPKLD